MENNSKPLTALKAAFALHNPVPMMKEMTQDEWRLANGPRMSILNDSWPHKIAALRAHFSLPMHSTPTGLTSDEITEHEKIIGEEWNEFWEAVLRDDIIEILDGGLDLIYTVLQLLLHVGFHPAAINACMEEVHAASLTKVDDAGKPVFNSAGKYTKTANYVPPNLPLAALNATPPQTLIPTEE